MRASYKKERGGFRVSFQSFSYFAFLPLVAFAYLKLAPKRFQTGLLLAASLLFYWFNRPSAAQYGGLWQALPLALLCASCVFVWRLGLAIQAAAPPRRGRLLAFGAALLLLVLALFKYYNLVLPLLPLAPGALHSLPFPLGVSFYTFAALSYLIDVRRGDLPAERSLVGLAAFLCFFGTITAGPICRARLILPQLKAEHRFEAARTVRALQLFALGLFKKVAVADVLLLFAQQVFGDLSGHGGPALLLALVFYTFYLYFDFVGYSEMARASALLLGLDIPENFKTPFFATNFSGFWSRWHISLSSWLQDYLFTPLVWADASRLPLVGRRVSRLSPVFCVAVVFFLSGFWHGSTLPFVVWGLLQAVYRAGEELLHQRLGKPKKRAPARLLWAKRGAVFCLWVFSMAFFAMGSGVGQPAGAQYGVAEAFALLAGLFRGWAPGRFAAEIWQAVLHGFYAQPLMAAAYLVFLALALALAFWLDWQRNFHFKNGSEELVLAAQKPAVRWALYYALVLGVFAGLVIQNGGFAGGSFAYGGF